MIKLYNIFHNKSEIEVNTFYEHINPIIESKQSDLVQVYTKLDKLEVILIMLGKR